MKRLIRYMVLAACLVAVSTPGRAPRSGQTAADNLLDQPIELSLSNGTLLSALTTLAVMNRIPIGLEASLSHKDRHHLNIDVTGTKLKDVLDMLVRQEPDYKWELRDGVINVLPARSRDIFVEKLLNTGIEHFAPRKGLGKFGIRDAILDLPEVRRLLQASAVVASHNGYFYRRNPYSKEADISISGTDVRGVLNKIIRESEHKMWTLSRSGSNLELLHLSF